MTLRADFGYAQARLQARYGQRPGESVWRQLGAAKTLAAYLETARGTVLAGRVANLSGASTVHDIEHSMRGQFNAATRETAAWVPPAWRPAVAWINWLPYLPVLRYLLDGEAVLPWMGEGRRTRLFLAQAPGGHATAIEQQGGGPLLEAAAGGRSLADVWLQEWRLRWPKDRHARADLGKLSAMLGGHVQRFAALESGDTRDARRELTTGLQLLFRKNAQRPVVVFISLALLALDLEYLRGDLVDRALFAEPGLPA